MNLPYELPLPPFYDPQSVTAIRPVSYRDIVPIAQDYAQRYALSPGDQDSYRLAFLGIDQQLTFCHPDFELFVAGRSGTGAIDDTRRVAEFIYRNLGVLSKLIFTLDTHNTYQIFFPEILVDSQGNHPDPRVPTIITHEEVKQGMWRLDTEAISRLNQGMDWGADLSNYLEYYTAQLESTGRFSLTIWPHHAMLGSIGHALMPILEEARFFHSLARRQTNQLEIKGNHPLTEFYSVYEPEVKETPDGKAIAAKNTAFLQQLLTYDVIIVSGEASSHCFAWTVADLLADIKTIDPQLAGKFYLLCDCISPVVIPEVVDYTEVAEQALQTFATGGMHLVQSTTPIADWPGIDSHLLNLDRVG